MTSEPDEGTQIRADRGADAGIAIGTMLGSYRIEARLGEGGMGVVYRATDTKLNRPVAIKFLADNLFDASARRRFQREAQTASGLNHPHIVTVYDVGEHDDRQYLVTELVDGGTLEDWARAEPHRWRQIVEMLVGVADALAAAHAASILHRDIKPTNILISQNGYAKLADFGLAKLVEDPDAQRRSGGRNTATGAIVGTAAYMSPEQAMGRPLDARSDIFTFGVLLYELLAHRHPFAGESNVVMLQSVIHAAPAALPDEIPEPLKTVVEKAIEKEPAERYQSMRELVVDLRRIARKSSATLPKAQPTPRHAWTWLGGALAATALVTAVGVGLAALLRARVAPSAEPSQFVILPPENSTFGDDQGTPLALSPDGLRLAFGASDADGVVRLWIRELSSLAARPLIGTEEAAAPFWSPDGRSLAFFARGKLRRIDIAGGPAQALADISLALGGVWGRDGTIIYAPGLARTLMRVPAAGGTPTPVTGLLPGVVFQASPQILPDGRHILFTAAKNLAEAAIVVASLDSPDEPIPLLQGSLAALYAEPGYLLFVRDNTLFAQGFDASRRVLRGEPMLIAGEIAASGPVAVSANGTLVYQHGSAAGLSQPVWVDRGGKSLGVAAPPGAYGDIALSPDGVRLAFDRQGAGGPEVWLADLQRGVTSRFTFGLGISNVPVWSPDGTQIAFAAGLAAGLDIYRRPANLGGVAEPLLELHAQPIVFPSDWSADGRYLAYYRTDPTSRNDVWVLPLDGERKPVALLHESYNEVQVQFSPDGKWIAYSSDESGAWQVYVQAFPKATGRWQVSNAGGTQPRWARDRNEIYYLAPDRKLMAATYTAGDAFSVGATQTLFETKLPISSGRQTYAVAPDGRFLLNSPAASASTPLTIVLNWPALLKK